MKKLILVLITAIVISGCAANEQKEESASPEPTSTMEAPAVMESDKKMTEQDIALSLNAVSTKFANKFSIDATLLAEPMRYDMTNDGKEEFVLFTKKQYNDGLENYYIGVYSIDDGSELFAEQYEAGDELLVAPISNPTYNHALAIINILVGGSGALYSAEVLAHQNDSFQSIAKIEEVEVGEPNLENILNDVDGDGFHEFKGYGYDFGPGSDRLSRADSSMDEMIYKWNDSSSSYEMAVTGADGLLDAERNGTGEITKEKALQIVQIAQKLQYDWMSPIETQEGVKELMRPFFSNNFVYEFLQAGTFFSQEYNGYLQSYTETGDSSWLLPTYDDDAVLEKSADGIYVYLKQSIEGESFTVQALTTLVKTKYGWMIDKLTFHNPEGGIDYQGQEIYGENSMEAICGNVGCNANP